MTEMQAAIGRVQLRKLRQWVDIRRQNAAILTEQFLSLEALRLTLPSKDILHSYYKYYVFIHPEKLRPGWDRDRIMNSIVAHGIPCFSGSCSEIYLEKAFTNGDLKQGEMLPVSKELGETSLMFLVHPTLIAEDMLDTAKAVQKVMAIATKK
jgi:dTDP-4-amino-4,6-dideoxygalactose transaminase